MAGMQFEYDEEGGTFFYFLLSFWALVLFPSTYFLWPARKEKDENENKRKCQCPSCQTKRAILAKENTSIKPTATKIGLAVGWIIFMLLVWKVSMIQLDYVEYDPFGELEIDRGATAGEIKRAYRKLSLIYHPDRETGDPKKFMRIAKAYAALTDEESRKNWEEYGNPDGPEATRFGIALPKWIVERENSMWVLAVYGLVFIIILPVVVGVWWYRSIKFSGDQVLLDTTRLYSYFINRTSNMILKRAIMILGASFEFDRAHNAEIIERPTDNEELPVLIRQLQNVQEKNRERPLCCAYSVKARALLLAHFQRIPLLPETLGHDQRYLLKKCPYLINEMVNICAGLVAMAMSGRVSQPPRLETIENIMKLSQMVIQAVEEKSSPLQQLPHVTPDMLRHFTTRKRDIRRIRDLINMKEADRRLMLRSLSDAEYMDVITVCAQLPHVKMLVKTEVLDEEDTTITAGSIVTVTVTLMRQDLGSMFEKEVLMNNLIEDVSDRGDMDREGEQEEKEGKELEEEEDEEKQNAQSDAKNKVWEKNKKSKKKGPKVKKKPRQAYQWKAAAQARADLANAKQEPEPTKGGSTGKSEQAEKDEEQAEEQSAEEENNVSEEEDQEAAAVVAAPEKPAKPKKSVEDSNADDDDDDDWDSYKMESKKENSLDTKIKESHVVHSPHFPGEKQEGWWLFVADRKHHLLITAPVHVCTLKTEETVQLKFSAPGKPGLYQFVVVLRSDSYFMDFDQSHTIKLDVKEAKVVEDHPQWDISDDEDEQDKDNNDETEDDSDYSSEDDESE